MELSPPDPASTFQPLAAISSPPERGAAVIASLTVASRIAGLVRTVVATAVLGVTYLGNTYVSANSVPNLLFEIFAGGALAAVLVPSLAAPLARGDREQAGKTASAFATNTLLVLSGVVAAGIFLRGPLMAALTSAVGDPVVRASERELGEFLLLAFLPQVWLYGIGVVLTGVLHAHNRFAGPALAPLLSSAVVTASYLVYGWVEGPSARDLFGVSTPGRLILGLGTTAGVAVLSLSLIVPVRRLGLSWRPVLKIPAEASRTTKRLIGSALIAVGAQQAMLAVVLVLANGVEGGVVAYQLAFAIFLLPWAVLALPLATASFPGMAAAAARGSEALFAERCAESARSLSLVAFGGASILFATSAPLSRILQALGIGGRASSTLVATGVSSFAPGLIGYGAYALLVRSAYARGDGRSPALASLAGFGGVVVLDLVAALFFTGRGLIGALAASFSIGIALGAAVLLVRLRRSAGPAAFAGVAATSLRGVVAAALAAVAGAELASVWSNGEVLSEVVSSAAAAVVAAAVYLAAQRLMGDRQMARALAALRGRPTPSAGLRGE